MAIILTVTVPDIETFEAYDYGYGTVIKVETVPVSVGTMQRFTVQYDEFERNRAYIQRDRFQSGLYGTDLFETVI